MGHPVYIHIYIYIYLYIKTFEVVLVLKGLIYSKTKTCIPYFRILYVQIGAADQLVGGGGTVRFVKHSVQVNNIYLYRVTHYFLTP